MHEPVVVKTLLGTELTVYEAKLDGDKTFVNGKVVDLLICNNDFSNSYSDWSAQLKTPMNPPYELGWYRRRKHTFFQHYNHLALEFSNVIGVSPAYMQVETELFENFDVYDADSLETLAVKVDEFIAKLKLKYQQNGISDAPFCFIKNNAGTYGLAVTQAHTGNDVREWNNKARKKMQAAKGGREVTELILQEGIPTIFREESGSAEPCIYTAGGELVGGFLRAHSEKGPDESLNSPGAVYKKLCMSDLLIDRRGCPMENVYGWVAKLGILAISKEAKLGNIQFVGYQV
jgi:glutamate--cysteine ligase